jgi:hypothetical protein
MPKHAEDARARAEARFRKQYEDNQVADQARADREAQAHAVEVKTNRLRSLRLAKETADKQADSPTPRESKRADPKKKRLEGR